MNVSHSSLDTVIKVKDFQLKKTQKELAQIKVKREQEEVALDNLEHTKSEALSDAARQMKARASDMQASRAFIHSLSQKIKSQVVEVEKINKAEDTKRGEVIERSQSKQMVEKLDQKRKEEVAKEEDRKQQRVMDVLAQRLRSTK